MIVVIGVAQAALTLGLAFRSTFARTVFGVLATVQAATAVYGLVALREVREGGAVGFAVAAAVLWFLYGTDETQAYFHKERATDDEERVTR